MTKTTLAVGFIVAFSLAALGCSSKPREAAGTVKAASATSPDSSANETAAQQSVRSIVLENERKIWEGFKSRDTKAVGALLADDMQVVTMDGRFNKSEFLKVVTQLPEIASYTISNASVISPSNEVVILTYDCQYVIKTPRLVNHSSFQTTIWVNRGGNWLAVFNQETPK